MRYREKCNNDIVSCECNAKYFPSMQLNEKAHNCRISQYKKKTKIFLQYFLGTALCIGLFSHVLKIDDSLIGVMACVGKIVAGFCYGLATDEWVYYLGTYIYVIIYASKDSKTATLVFKPGQ